MGNKRELLSKAVWTYRDIKSYFEVSTGTAMKIKQRAINETNGKIAYGTNYVKVDSVLALFGTSRIDEINVLNLEGND